MLERRGVAYIVAFSNFRLLFQVDSVNVAAEPGFVSSELIDPHV